MKYNNDNNNDKCIINIPPDYKLKHEYFPITTKVDLAGIEVEMNNGYLEISTSFIEIPFDINGISLSSSEPSTPIDTVIPIRQPINKTITLSDSISKSLKSTNTLPVYFTFPDDSSTTSNTKDDNSSNITPLPSPPYSSLINQVEIQQILNKVSNLNELTSTNDLYNIFKELINKINSDTQTKLKLPHLIKNNNNESLQSKYMKIQSQNDDLLYKLSELKSNNMFFYLRVNNYNLSKGKKSNSVTPKLSVKSYEYSDNNNNNNISLYDYVNDKWINYTYDRVFVDKEKDISTNNNNNNNNNQEDISNEIISSLLISILKGNNVSIFSCGLEKSGKTFTLFGNNNNNIKGISTLIIENLLNKLSSNSEISNFNITFSVCNIINEEITDLLSKEPTKIKISSAIGNVLNGINELPIKKSNHFEQIMLKIIEKYKNPFAQMVVTVNIEQKFNDSVKVIKNKINFVYLGNGDINKKNKSNQLKVKEQSINKVQNAISDVIIALDKKLKHIPYRNSKLTTILSDSFTKIVFIYNLQPKNELIDDNFMLLNFVNQFVLIENDRNKNVKKIETITNNNNINNNNNNNNNNNRSLNNEIKKLTKENEELKVMIQSYRSEIENIKSNQKLEINELILEHKLQNSEISKQLQSSLVKIRELEYEIQQKDEEINCNENRSEISKQLENNKLKVVRLIKEKNALHQSLQDKEMEIAQLKRMCKNKDLVSLKSSMKDYRNTMTIASILDDYDNNNNNNDNYERKYRNSKPEYASTLPPPPAAKSNNNNNNNNNNNTIITSITSRQLQQQQKQKQPQPIKKQIITKPNNSKIIISKPPNKTTTTFAKPVSIPVRNVRNSNIPKPPIISKRTTTTTNNNSKSNKNPALMSAAERRKRFGNNNNNIQKRIIKKPIYNRNNNIIIPKTLIKHNTSEESYKLNEIESSNIISPPLSKYERCSNGIYDDYEDEY